MDDVPLQRLQKESEGYTNVYHELHLTIFLPNTFRNLFQLRPVPCRKLVQGILASDCLSSPRTTHQPYINDVHENLPIVMAKNLQNSRNIHPTKRLFTVRLAELQPELQPVPNLCGPGEWHALEVHFVPRWPEPRPSRMP